MLQENIMERFVTMLGYIKDYANQQDSIKQRVLNKQTRKFLFNENAKVTKEIRKYEADLKRDLRPFDYKKGIANGTHLMEIVLEFEDIFQIIDVEKKVDSFVEMCV